MLALGDTAEEAFYSIFHLQAACEVQVSAGLGWAGGGHGGSAHGAGPGSAQPGCPRSMA